MKNHDKYMIKGDVVSFSGFLHQIGVYEYSLPTLSYLEALQEETFIQEKKYVLLEIEYASRKGKYSVLLDRGVSKRLESELFEEGVLVGQGACTKAIISWFPKEEEACTK